MDTWCEILFRTRLTAVDVERAAMEAANRERERKGEALAYTEDDFDRLREQLAEIEEQIRNAG
jgi:nuclear transport factor 2 (NTF2) superfamily protein